MARCRADCTPGRWGGIPRAPEPTLRSGLELRLDLAVELRRSPEERRDPASPGRRRQGAWASRSRPRRRAPSSGVPMDPAQRRARLGSRPAARRPRRTRGRWPGRSSGRRGAFAARRASPASPGREGTRWPRTRRGPARPARPSRDDRPALEVGERATAGSAAISAAPSRRGGGRGVFAATREQESDHAREVVSEALLGRRALASGRSDPRPGPRPCRRSRSPSASPSRTSSTKITG